MNPVGETNQPTMTPGSTPCFFSKCKEQLQSLCARICTEEVTGDQSLPIYTQEQTEPQPSIIMISGKVLMRNIENYL